MNYKKITAMAAAFALTAAVMPVGIFAAEAEISGVPVAGQYVEAEYDGTDEKAVCRWYVDGEKVKTQYHTQDKKSAYLIKDEDEGKKIKYEITSESGNAESAELEIYSGDTADKIAKVIEDVETAMGSLNAVGSNDSKLINEAEGCAVSWESDRSDIINSDGSMNLPLYDDGAVETKIRMTADVDGITVNKSYDIKTATQNYPVFARFNAEEEEIGAASEFYGGRFIISDEEAHSGEKSYKREREEVTGSSPYEAASYVIRSNATVPESPVTNDTLFITRMFSKLPNDSAEKAGNGLAFIGGSGGAVPYVSRVSDNPILKNDRWSSWTGISRRANGQIMMYVYGNMARNYYVDDFEVAKLCVGSIEITNDENNYTVEIPEYGENAVTQEFKYEVLNQYGEDFGMTYYENNKGVMLTEKQTAHFGIKGKLPNGVDFDTDTGILTVSSDAVEGEVTITATSDDGELPGNGWVCGERKITLKAKGKKKPQIRNAKVAGVADEGTVLEAAYEYYHPTDEVEEGTSFRWLVADTDDESAYMPIEGATDRKYTVTANEAGKCIRCEITPKTADGETGNAVRTNIVSAAAPPQALDIGLIEPEYFAVGASIGVSYRYYDINLDREAATEYVWQRSDSKTDGFTDISGSESVRSGSGYIAEYTFTNDDIDKYIRVKILPKSENPDDISEPYYSEATPGPAYPFASNVGISGNVKVGNTVTGAYKYSHIHGYEEADSKYEWYVDETLAGTGKKYTIKDEDEGKELSFSYTPRTLVAPEEGITLTSAKIKVRGASNIETDGVPIPGETLTACDIGGGKNVCKWYADGVQVKAQYHSTGSLSTYLISENDVGKQIKYVIYPADGSEKVESAEQIVYGGETAAEIKDTLKEIEAALGDLNAVGGENSRLVSSVGSSPVSWESGNGIEITDGKIQLPLYDDGPKEGTLKMSAVAAGVNITKTYNVKTATQHYPIFMRYDAEDEKIGEAANFNSAFTVTDEEKNSGKASYKRVIPEKTGSSPWTLMSFNVGNKSTTPASPIDGSTLYAATMYGKLPSEYGGNCGNGAMYIAGGGAPYGYVIESDKGMNNKTWTRWIGFSTLTNVQVQALVYNQLPLQYLIDDFEIAKMCVGHISISNKEENYTVTIPNDGDDAAVSRYTANVYNQYGTLDGMRLYNTSDGKQWGVDQTVHFAVEGNNLDGVEIDPSTGVLTVSSNAKEGEITVKAIADKTSLPGSGWVSGEKKVTLISNSDEKPQARNVFARGVLKAGARITAGYEFYQKSDEVEDGTTYQWLIADEDKAESYKPIEGEDTLEYTVKAADVGKFIRCEITPKTADGITGEAVRTNVVASETAPQILDSKIIEPEFISTGASIELKYTFYDVNYDNEAATEYTWQRSDSKDGGFTDISGTYSVRSGADGEKVTYTFTEEDTDKYIRIKIMPKSDAEPFSPSKPYYGEAIYGPSRPTAAEVGISGSAKAGNVLTGTYKFVHPHSYGEEGSVYAWYADGTKVGTEAVYTVQSADEGKSICFEVTPKSSVAPFDGKPVKSASVTVSRKSDSGISIGGGGGDSKGGSTYGGGSAAISQITPKPQYQNPFTDITNHWAYDDIVKMAELGIAKGTSENTFSPENGITRAEFVTLALRVLNEDEREYTKIFSDVAEDKWYAGYMTAAAQLKIISDKAEKAYPESLVTRQEMAKIAVEAYKASGRDIRETVPVSFADSASINEWAKEYVNTASNLGIIKGEPNGNFNPSKGATRAEALTVIKRLYELLES